MPFDIIHWCFFYFYSFYVWWVSFLLQSLEIRQGKAFRAILRQILWYVIKVGICVSPLKRYIEKIYIHILTNILPSPSLVKETLLTLLYIWHSHTRITILFMVEALVEIKRYYKVFILCSNRVIILLILYFVFYSNRILVAFWLKVDC